MWILSYHRISNLDQSIAVSHSWSVCRLPVENRATVSKSRLRYLETAAGFFIIMDLYFYFLFRQFSACLGRVR